MLRTIDIWRSAIVRVPTADLRQSDLAPETLLWLPQPSDRFTFRADPFGLWHEEKLHIFVERFDYRSAKGAIEVLIFDSKFNFMSNQLVLEKPWHLSYPFVFKDKSAICMLPEANRSGELTLYKADAFPLDWSPMAMLDLPGRALDPTPLFHSGRWWIFYGLRQDRSSASLNIAFAERLAGPWTSHPANPIRVGTAGTRPGGTPVVNADGTIDLPLQDNARTYGGAIRKLRISRLDDTFFEAEDLPWLTPSEKLHPFNDGVHTLSSVGDITLIDCKATDRSISGTLAWRRGRFARRKRRRLGEEI